MISVKKKILVVLRLLPHHKEALAAALRGFEDRWEIAYIRSAEPAMDELADASVIIGDIEPEHAAYAQRLEWYQHSFAGTDRFTVPGVLRKDTVLTSAVGAYGLAVSEHMLMQTFAMLRRMGAYARNQSHHEWKLLGAVEAVEGATVAVLGMGDIGCSYARRMRALGAYTIGLRRTVAELPDGFDEQHPVTELDEVLPRADIVAMALPGGPETYHILNEERLRLMKRGAFLLNVGRGGAIDPEALKTVLREGLLGGAALDVTEPEPLPPDDELWDFENVIITPHAAGKQYGMPQTLDRIVSIAAENLARWVRGEPLRNVTPHN